jgi:peptidyl-prolyl cis-trans isomerase C
MLRLHAATQRRARHRLACLATTAICLAVGAAGSVAHAASPSTAGAPTSPPAGGSAVTAPADPVIAKVNDQPIYLSDLQAASQNLPDNLRNMPPQMLYPMMLDQMIDGRALVIEAKKDGLDKDPTVAKQIAAAEDRALQSAMLSKIVGPAVTDDAVKARFEKDQSGKAPEEEIHARHILVATEAEAKKLIAELDKGADFATLAKQNSTDPGAKEGGDLGFFRKDDMVPEFAAAAFALKPGEITQTPVHTQFGWHVIKVEERRPAAPVTFDQSKDELRQRMIQEGVQQALAKARAQVTVQKFNMDGTPIKATDTAQPPPSPSKKP